MSLYEEQITEITAHELPWQKLENKTILLTGATGMIGKCLIDVIMVRNQRCHENIKIIALSRDKKLAMARLREHWENPCFKYFTCDVNEPLMDFGTVDYIIHAASNTHPLQYANDPIGTIASNVIGTKNLLDYAVTHKTKQFCFLSSVEIYGENRGDVEKFNEEYMGYVDCNTLRAGYPESKRLGECLCNAYRQTYGLDFVVPRLSRVYGPTMLRTDSKAISQFIRSAAAGEDIILKSEGNQRYSYSFVSDAAKGILYTMLLGVSGEAYNIADSKSDISLKELAAYLAGITKSKVVFQVPKESEKRGYSVATKAMLDADKLGKLGWSASIHMEEGLKCAVESMKKSM